MKTVGVLALQGDFEAHHRAIERVGAQPVDVRSSAKLQSCDALIIPGGESTTMLKLMEIENLAEPLRQFAALKPVFGTCAGAILLAHAVTGPAQKSLDILDIDVERNAYGRQIDSRVACIHTPDGEMEAVFIRAPIIRRVGVNTRVLATYLGDPVWIEQGRHMATTFHPELSDTSAVHRRFIERV